jgi:SAM-dependent methyltransferase
MSVTDLISAEPAPVVLVDEMTPSETVVDSAHLIDRALQRLLAERHGRGGYPPVAEHHAKVPGIIRPLTHFAGHTGEVSTTAPTIWFGDGVADETELRLCGEVHGKRVIELGVAPGGGNVVEFARHGAKSIAVDPSPERIAEVRRAAQAAEVQVECHTADLADLGFATSASVDLVVCSHRLATVDDVPRLLRQAHRVLRPEAPIIVAVAHPAGAMLDATGQQVERPYGEGVFSMSALLTLLLRADLRVDVVHELRTAGAPNAPSTLVVRARKLGV